MLIIVFPKVPQLLRMFRRTRVLVPHTKSELSIWIPKDLSLPNGGALGVWHKEMSPGWLIPPSKNVQASTQSLAHVVPLLSMCLSAIKSYRWGEWDTDHYVIYLVWLLSLEHVCSKPALPAQWWTWPCDSGTCPHHSSLDHSNWFNARDSVLLPTKLCAEKPQFSYRSLLARNLQRQILICSYASLGSSLGSIALSCSCTFMPL